MKHIIALSCIGLAASSALAGVVQPAALPPYTHIDTEVSTNFPCAFGNKALEKYSVETSFFATPSNCVEIAFGRDADGDLILSPDEADLSFGRDCGRWVLRGPNASFSQVADDSGSREEVSLRFEVDVKGQHPERCIISLDGDKVELPSRSAGADSSRSAPVLPRWFFNPDWNMVRITTRGIDAASERIRLETSFNALVIRVR